MTADYPLELTAPDISPYRQGNTGIAYLHRFDSGVPGPHAMVTAIVHGNEICGAIALDWLLREAARPARGVLSLCFVNPEAYGGFDPGNPYESRGADEDLNRLWAIAVLEGSRNSRELRRARELRPTLDTVDFLLDIHSMSRATHPVMLAGPLAKGRALARRVGIPDVVVSDAGHEAGVRMRDYDGFAAPSSPKNALLVECGQHWRKGTAELAIRVTARFLRAVGVADAGLEARASGPGTDPPQRCIEVTGPYTVQTDAFRFTENWQGLEVIPRRGTLIGYDGDTPVRTPYDNCVLVMPTRAPRRGGTAVRFGREAPAEG